MLLAILTAANISRNIKDNTANAIITIPIVNNIMKSSFRNKILAYINYAN